MSHASAWIGLLAKAGFSFPFASSRPSARTCQIPMASSGTWQRLTDNGS
jgi:hypothetical protein